MWLLRPLFVAFLITVDGRNPAPPTNDPIPLQIPANDLVSRGFIQHPDALGLPMEDPDPPLDIFQESSAFQARTSIATGAGRRRAGGRRRT